MLGDDIKEIRKKKGFTQEELAIKLNVVRQTVSKWEKGFSVPDADMLQKIADVLDVNTNQLLGTDIGTEEEAQNNNEIAERLSKISEQLAIKNKRTKTIWKIVGIVLLAVIVLNILSIVFGGINSTEIDTKEDASLISITM